MTLDEALTKLRAAKPLLDRYGVARVGVFGSTARKSARSKAASYSRLSSAAFFSR